MLEMVRIKRNDNWRSFSFTDGGGAGMSGTVLLTEKVMVGFLEVNLIMLHKYPEVTEATWY